MVSLIRGPLRFTVVQVTFKEPEAAKKACEDATPVINGRRANCNLASLGARRLRASPTVTPTTHQPGTLCLPRQPLSSLFSWI